MTRGLPAVNRAVEAARAITLPSAFTGARRSTFPRFAGERLTSGADSAGSQPEESAAYSDLPRGYTTPLERITYMRDNPSTRPVHRSTDFTSPTEGSTGVGDVGPSPDYPEYSGLPRGYTTPLERITNMRNNPSIRPVYRR